MLFLKFELIPIKIGFFKNFKVAPKSDQRPCTIVHGLWPNFIKNGKERIICNMYTLTLKLFCFVYCTCTLYSIWFSLSFFSLPPSLPPLSPSLPPSLPLSLSLSLPLPLPPSPSLPIPPSLPPSLSPSPSLH